MLVRDTWRVMGYVPFGGVLIQILLFTCWARDMFLWNTLASHVWPRKHRHRTVRVGSSSRKHTQSHKLYSSISDL